MAYTEDDIEKLETAIASGHSSVSYKDRTVDYRSVDEMERILRKMKREVRGESASRRNNPQYDSGL